MPFMSVLTLVEADKSGEWIVSSPLIYVSNVGVEYVVPTGTTTDLASIPVGLRNIVNQNGKSRSPAVLHDFFYRTGSQPRNIADKLFYEALLSKGVQKTTAYAMYIAVRLFGASSYNDKR